MLYELKNLKKVYGRRTVLDLPALSLEQGRIIALLVPMAPARLRSSRSSPFSRLPPRVRFGS